jgi:hypothetical protein
LIIEKTIGRDLTMSMGPALMAYDHLSATLSGNVPVLYDGQPDVPAVDITERALTVEKNGDTFLAQTPIGVSGDHVPAVAAGDLSDVSPPTATMTRSGTLLVKNAVHISLSTLKTGVTGKLATDCSLVSAARRTQGVPWLCVPPSREVCLFELLQDKE